MKQNEINIKIIRPIGDVFAFTINPNNTHLWIDSVIKESINTDVVGLGTIYSQIVKLSNGDQGYTKAEITIYIKNELIEFSFIGTTYKCRYSYATAQNGTSLTYFEEAENDDDLPIPMEKAAFLKLKKIIEGEI